ncbi:MAG TPA: TatD family hydrolase [Candidatus Ornithospirochaeta avicola]|uniref:TatD family hydrolase n=1 Tax=Candidatus Ornithospirochaeta avicola TaxID=2840896 RepID=A0A9D1PSV7_9SPIO|nr:TatD family hydrolase [Candidatus Ornithospirochaeta avicola]
MFDFHAHGGKIDCNAFISYSADEYQRGKRNRYMSLMYLPWLDGYNVRTYIETLFSDDNLMAGEIGLDSRFKDKDQSAFYTILEALEGSKKTVVIHSVRNDEKILNEIRRRNIEKAIFHSFSSSLALAFKIADAGCYFSIKENFLSKKNWKEYLSLPFLLETDMKTGYEQEEKIAFLYSKIAAESGIDVYSLMEERKKELFDDQQD